MFLFVPISLSTVLFSYYRRRLTQISNLLHGYSYVYYVNLCNLLRVRFFLFCRGLAALALLGSLCLDFASTPASGLFGFCVVRLLPLMMYTVSLLYRWKSNTPTLAYPCSSSGCCYHRPRGKSIYWRFFNTYIFTLHTALPVLVGGRCCPELV